MTDKVTRFCDQVHGKLEALEGRMDSLKLNIGTTWHSLQEKLHEVRRQGAVAKPDLAEARSRLERWKSDHQADTTSSVDRYVTNRDTLQLAARAATAADAAWTAIMLAEASFDEAERMILEAISAQLDAEAVTAE